MAATTITPAQAELISSLTQDEIPIKLRCAICRRLAVNAFRLPCCDQAICESCQSTLPESCPVCEHSPVSAEDCKPNKALRTTIKVFLKTEEKKREALRAKEAKTTPPETPAPVVETLVEPTSPPKVEVAEEKIEEPAANKDISPIIEQEQSVEHTAGERATEAEQDIPQPSIEEIAPGQEPTQEEANPAGDNDEDRESQNDEKDANGQSVAGQAAGFGAGFGFDASNVAGFPGMGVGGDSMQQMQMQQMMQQMMMNGMAPGGFGNFPMMGGMSMDPMAMQNMMSGGFGAGMNGMNMGMGNMGGYEGNAGAGFNNGWNTGQQSWNVGQDNYNHPNAASGMGHGDYGSTNSGYAAQGYNQGNYGRGNYNDYQNNFGYRGRGRGRGGYSQGRGGYGYGSNDISSQQYPQQQQAKMGQPANGTTSESGSAVPTGPKALVPDANVDEFGREIRQGSEAQAKGLQESDPKVGTPAVDVATTENGDNTKRSEDGKVADDSAPKPIQSYYTGNYDMGHHSGFGARGSMHPPAVKVVDVPINAPTGPKAMRAGLPNTGLSGLRSRSFAPATSNQGRSVSLTASVQNVVANAAPEPLPETKERERSRSRDREPGKRSRSQSRDRRHKHRHRSTSMSEDEKETERRRQRRKERREEDSRRRREDRRDDDVEPVSGEREKERDDERPRSASPSGSRRSTHRSRRDKDGYRERSDRTEESSSKHRGRDREDKEYRERDRDEESSKYRDHDRDDKYREREKGHRSRRHRDDRERSRSRDRDHDREHRHRHSRRASKVDESGARSHGEVQKDLDTKIEQTLHFEKEKANPVIDGKKAAAEDIRRGSSPKDLTEPRHGEESVRPEESRRKEEPRRFEEPKHAEEPKRSEESNRTEEARKPSVVASGGRIIEIKGASTRKKNEIKIPTGPRTSGTAISPTLHSVTSTTSNPKDLPYISSRDRDRDRDRSSRHDDDRRHSRNDPPTKSNTTRDPPKSSKPAPTAATPTADPHTLEREARNRERLLKEAQRIAGLGLDRKRSRDEGQGGARKKSRGGEGHGDEARIARLEKERESARWG